MKIVAALCFLMSAPIYAGTAVIINANNNSGIDIDTVKKIYLGKVKKVVSGLNAAFVNVGHEKDGFLHYLDFGPNVNSYKKFTDKVISKKSNTASLKNFRKEKEIEKELMKRKKNVRR